MTDTITTIWADYEAKLKSRLAALKPLLLTALQSANVASVAIEYDGEGDNGQINAIVATDAAGARIDLTKIRMLATEIEAPQADTIDEFVNLFCWDALAVYHSGFENNDGGFGRITIDVPTGAIELERNDRFVDYTTLVKEV